MTFLAYLSYLKVFSLLVSCYIFFEISNCNVLNLTILHVLVIASFYVIMES